MSRRDHPAERPGTKAPLTDGAGLTEDRRARQGILKYKCYSTTQVDSKGFPVLLREAGLFSKIPEQVLVCSDINKNFTMLAVRHRNYGFEGTPAMTHKSYHLRLLVPVATCGLVLLYSNASP